MLELILAWLRENEGPLAYLAIAAASLVEYVFPPFPGDTVALFGVFLSFGAGYRASLVYLALNLGAIAGGQLAWAFGRRFRTAETRPGWLRGPRAEAAIQEVIRRYETHGSVYLALNRFVPALRGFFFIAAGMAGLPFGRVLVFGAISAMLWNALLMGLGAFVGANWAQLSRIVSAYTWGTLGLLAAVSVLGFVLWRRRAATRTPGAVTRVE